MSNNYSPDQKVNPSAQTTSSYLRQIQKFPMLGAEEEYELATKWAESGDKAAAEHIIKSHMKLVAKIAAGYRGYGLHMDDLISEGTIGMMKALNRFDPEKGFRFSTYATWWIRASLNEYVMRGWSLVRMGKTRAQKSLFYNLSRLKNKIGGYKDQGLSPQEQKGIAKELNISIREVREMEQRLGGKDYSLNATVRKEEEGEWQDWLEDETIDQESDIIEQDEFNKRSELLSSALKTLKPREYIIFKGRHLKEPPATLAEIAEDQNLSRERVRQIEMKTFAKIQKLIRQKAASLQMCR